MLVGDGVSYESQAAAIPKILGYCVKLIRAGCESLVAGCELLDS